jgi:N-acetylglucosamine-6-phosphate deacetylase
VKDGKALTLDGALAGSTLDLWNGVKNLMKFADASLADAVLCATVNPSRMVGIDGEVGSIEAGKRADLLLVDDQLNLCTVIARGEILKEDV